MPKVKLSIKNLSVNFKTDDGLVQAVRDISLELLEGETLAIVGESGSGKSVTSKAVMGLLDNGTTECRGEIIFDGRNIVELPERELNKLRGGKISMIFQDPMSSLNPIVKIGRQLTEAMLLKLRRKRHEARGNFFKSLVFIYRLLGRCDANKSPIHRLREVLMLAGYALRKAKEDRGRAEFLHDSEYEKHILALLSDALGEYSASLSGASALPHHIRDSIKGDNESTDSSAEASALFKYLLSFARDAKDKLSKREARERAVSLLDAVGISEPSRRYNQYPFELSGGMRQRIVIAIALACDPEVLICDEPTTALDVTIQAQILELINKIKEERGLSVIFITHDLGAVANMADRIAVMYAGRVVETGMAEEVFYDPRHPYTWALLSSVPDLDTAERLESIPGSPPSMLNPPEGDAFAPRNKYALKIDFVRQPPVFFVSETHSASTWLLHPLAPTVEMPIVIRKRIERMRKMNGGDACGYE